MYLGPDKKLGKAKQTEEKKEPTVEDKKYGRIKVMRSNPVQEETIVWLRTCLAKIRRITVK